jgi:protein-S-isoprenylcysteine O-methyltransferase Ste14
VPQPVTRRLAVSGKRAAGFSPPLFSCIGAPVVLGSLWGVGIGAAMLLLLAGRIVGEEKMLTEELEGYADYKKRVRYRLIPFVW